MMFESTLTIAVAGALALGLAPQADTAPQTDTAADLPLMATELDERSVLELPDLSSGQLSSQQLDELLTSTGNVPENCWVRYFGQTSICMEVICVEDGVWVTYDCWQFGL